MRLSNPRPKELNMSAKILLLPVSSKPISPFDQLTDQLVMEQAKAGTLNPAVVEALLAAVRQPGRECSR